MNKLAFKKEILEKAKERQSEIISDFRSRIEELRNSEVGANEDQYDHEQQSHNNANQELIDNLHKELNFTEEEMVTLNRLQVTDEPHNEITLGSVVKTDQYTFFPSVSIERFRVNNEEIFGLSAKAPLFQAMRGKKAGDSFTYNDHQYKIEEVF